jgi:COX assembly mitochondrial protein 2
MNALEACHARGFMWKAMGMCNEAKEQVTLCLRAERLKRSSKHREDARVKNTRVQKLWSDIDENS